MAKIDCFKGIKIAGLQEEFEKRISEGMSDTQLRDIGTQVALEQFNKLDADLVKLKKSIGQKAKAQNLTYEPKQVENETKEQQEEPLLEGVQDGGKQNETGQESPELRTEETQEVEPQTQEADALQQVQRETEESVLRDERVEETSQEEAEQQTQTPQEKKIESPKSEPLNEINESSIPDLLTPNQESRVSLIEDVNATVKTIELPDGDIGYSVEIRRGEELVQDRDGDEVVEMSSAEEVVQYLRGKQRGFKLSKQPRPVKGADERLSTPPEEQQLPEGTEVEFSVFGGLEKGVIQSDGRVKSSESGVKYRIGSKIGQATINENFQSALTKGLDVADNYLKSLEDKLDEFGSETLGINIPVAVTKAAIKSGRVALKAGKSVSQVVDAMLESMFKSPWYQKLTDSQKSEAEAEIIRILNTPATSRASVAPTLKSEDVFIRSGNIVKDNLRSFRKRLFSARRFLPKSLFAFKEDKEAQVARQLSMVEQTAADLRREFKKIKGEAEKAEAANNLDAFLRGDESVDLSEELKDIGTRMRNQIDGLSSQLINLGLVEESRSDVIEKNIGEYLTRSYKVFDRKNWKKEVQEETKQKARNFLREELRPIAEESAAQDKRNRTVSEILDDLVDKRIDEILTKEGAENFISGGRLGSKDLSTLRKRKDIPTEIRALMGEYTDPLQNYARTIQKMSNLVANAKFLADAKERGMGTFFFERNDPNRPKEFNTKIAAEGSDTMNPLNGIYTTKEIAQEFEASQNELGKILETYMKVVSGVKWAKTIGSIATHSKNIIGNLGFMMANGHWRLGEMGEAYKVVKNDISKMSNQELRNRMNYYIGLGIVKQSAGLGEIKDMFKDANFDDALVSRLSNENLNFYQKTKRSLLKGKKVAEDLYQAEDDFFKIVAFENELSRYSDAIYEKTKSDLTAEERSNLESRVAEIVKNTYPTYDRVPEAIQMIRRFPFIGNFVSFQAEAWRTMYNTVDLASRELRSNNPKIKKIGAERLVGILSYESFKDGILAYFGLAAGTGMAGIFGALFNSDEEDEKQKDVRKFVAPWSKSADLIVMNASGGKINYIDFSASDPHGGLRQTLNAFLENDGSIETFINSLYQVIEPFVGEEIATAAIRDLLDNNNGYGGDIYNPEDSKGQISSDIISHLYKTFELGTLTTARRLYNSDNPSKEFAVAFLGFRPYEVDIAKQFGFQVKDYADQLRNARKIYNSAYYSEKTSQEEKDDAYERADRAVKDVYKEMRDVYESAIRLGTDPQKLKQKMSDFGISKYRIEEVVSGNFSDLKRKDAVKKSKKPKSAFNL